MYRVLTILPLAAAAVGCVRIEAPVSSSSSDIRGPTVYPRHAEKSDASGRRSLEPRLFTTPISGIPRTHPKVGRRRGSGSLSIGTTKNGFIVGCREMPIQGNHHRVLPEQAVRNTRCGTVELVDALLAAGRDVARVGEDSLLPVGNLSRVGGGDIPWSISHNSGRDADVGLYLNGPDGRQVIPDNFVQVDSTGKGEWNGLPVTLDRDRTWKMVKSLVTNRKIEIQWLFVADHVRSLLLDHAAGRKESARLIRKAALAMAQPGWSNPHDDHIHVRVYCSVDDLLEGCQDWGSNRPWFVDRTRRIERRARELRRLLRSSKPGIRADSATVLGRMGRSEALSRIVRLLKDRSPRVRVAASRAIGRLGVWGVTPAVLHAIGTVSEGEAVEALLEAINRKLSGKRRARVLSRLLSSHREYQLDFGPFSLTRKVGDWAFEQLAGTRGREAAEALIGALRRTDVDVLQVNEVLVRLTATEAAGPQPAVDDELAGYWEDWWSRNEDKSPIEWIEDSFRKAGVLSSLNGVDTKDIPALTRVLQGDPLRSHAALRMIVSITDRTLPRFPRESIEPVPVLVEKALDEWSPPDR